MVRAYSTDELLVQGLIQMDETYLQVLRSEKSPSSNHYMVVRIAGPPHRRIILFDYIPSRTTEALKALLIGADGPFRGKLLTDGLELYDLVAEQLKLQHFGCAQHARTYFHKALKVTELPSGRALARVAMEDYLAKVFKIERQIKELRADRERAGDTLTPEEVVQRRREHSAPILTAFKKWVDDLLPGTAPQSALGKALAYTVRHYAERETMPDESPVENGRWALRPSSCPIRLRGTRHSLCHYKVPKNCNSRSSALKRRGFASSGRVLANAASFNARWACM